MENEMTIAQRKLIERMQAGHRLWWFGDNGPELIGCPFWPQKRTVRALLRAGVLQWKPPQNKAQAESGICELELTTKVEKGK